MMSSFSSGFMLGAGLILAIGAQNVFVLRQGLSGHHIFAVALFCAGTDALLIAAGVGGVGALISGSALLTRIAAWGGALFLLGYGAMAARRAFAGGPSETIRQNSNDRPAPSLRATLAVAAAVSLFNPHVYLDTVILLGGLGAQHQGVGRVAFAAGAATASFVWFFALAYGARAASALFDRPAAQRGLDVIAAAVMLIIAIGLIVDQLSS